MPDDQPEPMPALTLDDQLCFALYSANNLILDAYRPLLSEIGLTYHQYLALLVLWNREADTIPELSARLGLTQSQLSSTVEEMRRAGLIVTSDKPGEELAGNIALTARGNELKVAAADIQNQVVCRTELSKEAYRDLRSKLMDMVHNIQHGV